MDYDYAKRNYLFPEGCKDLIEFACYLLPEGCKVQIDLTGLKGQRKQTPKPAGPMSKIGGEMIFSERTSVRQLAELLGQHPSRIIVDLLELGVYSCVTTQLEFRTIQKIARKYGYEAKTAP
jgi:hypothetical protein